MRLLAALLVSRILAAPLETNQLQNPSFQGLSGWVFWTASPDSASATGSTTSCRSDPGCLEIRSLGSQYWVETSAAPQRVQAGEIWQLDLWTRVDTLSQTASVCFVTQDSSGAILDRNEACAAIPVDSGWRRTLTRLYVPRGCAALAAKLIGKGLAHLRVDDADLHRVSASPAASVSLRVADDSVSVEVDPSDLSLEIANLQSRDTVRFGSIRSLRLDSAANDGDSLRIFARSVATGDPFEFDLRPHGGGVVLSLRADTLSPMPADLDFPGPGTTKSGQFLVMPRGTGLAVPVESFPDYALRNCGFWEWQISQALAGATDGRTGYVLSVDQPWDVRQQFQKGANGLLFPQLYQVASKGRWGQDRSLLVAPLRGGGWTEIAKRHRARLDELGRIRNWTGKMRSNPAVERLRGAVDFWPEGSWPDIPEVMDTLRLLGMDRAIVNSASTIRQVDSLVGSGWLASSYQNFTDGYPDNPQVPSGVAAREDGSLVRSWTLVRPDGTTEVAMDICSGRHPGMARGTIGAQILSKRRNAQFLDVELSWGLQECWSIDHPTDRARDAANRFRTLSILQDSLNLVMGSEQHRDFATSVVDWGEGSMSIASVPDAGSDWTTPEAPGAAMDSLSMSPAYRVPLLPLATHDAFAPTWYTGDGQSKVPARWDDKDAWNALYATMALLAPVDRRMWDSLRPRYLRSANLLGAIHSRCGFEAMTDFAAMSGDREVQRTSFANGWTVVANFDGVPRTEAGPVLPPKGFLATNGVERVERSLFAGVRRSRARLADRWFLDPESDTAEVDGIRTAGPVFLRREDDSTLLLSLVGDQGSVDIAPGSLPWPSATLRADDWSTRATVPLGAVGAGRWRLVKQGSQRFYRLSGAFGGLTRLRSTPATSFGFKVLPTGPGWEAVWNADAPGTVRLDVFGADGRILFSRSVNGSAGSNRTSFPASGGCAWARLRAGPAVSVAAIPRAR